MLHAVRLCTAANHPSEEPIDDRLLRGLGDSIPELQQPQPHHIPPNPQQPVCDDLKHNALPSPPHARYGAHTAHHPPRFLLNAERPGNSRTQAKRLGDQCDAHVLGGLFRQDPSRECREG